ncbi:MAG: diguanylate cyclase [Nitrospiraceae bacterium]|nr:MAG: diguanylate cyclase [Nitrospiraceae bacterium]
MHKKKHRILAIGSSGDDRNAFKRFSKKMDAVYDHVLAKSVAEAAELLSSERFDAIICSSKLSDGTASDILDLKPAAPVIVVAERGSLKTAVQLMKSGAADYLVKAKGSAGLERLSQSLTDSFAREQKDECGGNIPLYRDIIDAANILIWRTDAEGRFTFINPAWEKIHGYMSEELIGRPFSDFQMPEAAEYYINEFRNCMIGEPVIGHETTFFSKQGDEILLVINMVPIIEDTGTVIGTQGIAYDMSERRRADELMQYISAKDELTGLYNLHTFLSMTEQQIKTAHREKKEILIIYAGVDNMRSINEEHGQHTGDQVLIDTANILRKTFREADILARTGGDEFVVSTLVSSKDTAALIMKRLEENFAEYNEGKNGTLELSLSFGASCHNTEQPVSIEELLSHADEKMHEAKKKKKG